MTAAIFQNAQVTGGIGKESVYGTAVSPGFYLPIGSLSPDDVNAVVPDSSLRGAPGDAWGYVGGSLTGSTPFGGDVHADTIGFPLAGVLGDVASSGSGPVTWTMAVLNTGSQQPSSYTLTTTDGVNSRQWPGLKFTSLELLANSTDSLKFTAQAVSLASNTTSGPTTSYTTVKIVPAWVGVIALGGVTVPSVLSCSVKITRAVEAKSNTDGTQAPYLQRSGVCLVSGSLQLILQTDSYRSLYVAGTASSIDMNWQQGAGATLTQTKVHCSSIMFTNVQPDYSTGAFQQVSLDWVANYNTTDAGASGGTSPVKVTLKNAVVAGSY